MISADELLKASAIILSELFPQKFFSKHLELKDTLEHDLGLDSLAQVEFLTRLEKKFNTKFRESDFTNVESLGDIYKLLLSYEGYHGSVESLMQEQLTPDQSKSSFPSVNEVKTLVDVLDWQTKWHPDKIHVQLFKTDETSLTLTYKNLKLRAETIAAGLQQLKLKKGDKVVLMLPTGFDYLCGFFGVLFTGAIPVPIYPLARPNQLEDHIRRHQLILTNCKAQIIIAPQEIKTVARLLKSQVESVKHILSVDELERTEFRFVPEEIHPTNLALIQYTSGSTGNPKGVMLTHENLLANIRAMGETLQVNQQDVLVSWLPLYHDMGLIGAWLGSLYYGIPLVLMSPLSFLSRPEQWLWAIHQSKATISAAPNFAYELCLSRINDLDLNQLNLSSVRALLNGAEAVGPDTIDRFAERFQKYGLKKAAILPVYGLAESSVGLCFSPLGRGPAIQSIDRKLYMEKAKAVATPATDPAGLRFVGCGYPLPGHEIRVVDAFQHQVLENTEGEIQFRGPSSTSGYFNNDDETKKLYSGSWLVTGDRGYISNGELFVTGRTKDIIIRGGRHIYPQEIESAVGEIAGIRKGRVIAFGTKDLNTGTEKLVVVAETHEEKSEQINELKFLVNKITTELIGDPPEEIVLTAPGSILKTSSGKLRRAATRELYDHGQLGLPPRQLWKQVFTLVVGSAAVELKSIIRAFGSLLFTLYCWIVFFAIAAVAWLAVMVLPQLQWRWNVLHYLAQVFFKFSFLPVRTIGSLDVVSLASSTVYICNHSSYLDSLVLLATLPNPVCFVAKAELSKFVLLSMALKRIGVQFIERFEIEKSLEDAKKIEKILDENKSILFFPEGTFTRNAGLLPFHSGAFVLAAKKNSPVVPLCITGTRSILPAESRVLRRHAIEVYIGERIFKRQISEYAVTELWSKADTIKNSARKFILEHNHEPEARA